MSAVPADAARPRILIYCHNVHGLGHVVRSVRIATALEPGRRCRVRLVTGCRFLDRLDPDPKIEIVRLPALVAEAGGRVAAVDGTPLGKTLAARGQRIREQLLAFRPQVMLVDHNPLGLIGELRPALDEARRSGLATRFVWGVRDILAAAGHVERMLAFSAGPEGLRRAVARYHSAIGYADASWLDAFAAYRDLALPARTASVGFITGPRPACHPPAADRAALDGSRSAAFAVAGRGQHAGDSPRVVALSGGGAQAAHLAELLLAALAAELRAGRIRLRLVVGPFTPASAVEVLVAGCRGVEVWAEGASEDAIQDASLVVARVGYNTAYTLMRSPLPVVLVPIRSPDGEQALRAARLGELAGVWNVAGPEDEPKGDVVARLAAAISDGLARGARARHLPFAVDGARGAAAWLLRAAEDGRCAGC